MGEAQVHAVPFNCASHPADERDSPIGVLALHDADMGQPVVHPTVPVGVPGIVEKNEVTRTSGRPMVKSAMFPNVVVDQADAVGLLIGGPAVVEVDAMFQEDGSGDAGTIVGHSVTVDFYGTGTNEP